MTWAGPAPAKRRTPAKKRVRAAALVRTPVAELHAVPATHRPLFPIAFGSVAVRLVFVFSLIVSLASVAIASSTAMMVRQHQMVTAADDTWAPLAHE